MIEVVSRGRLREILAAHIERPSKLAYEELPPVIGREMWLALSEADRTYYVEDTSSGRRLEFHLPPGSYDAWMVTT